MLSNELESQGNWLFKHRGVLPILILVPALVVFYLQVKNHGDAYLGLPSYYPWLCLAVGLLGLVIRAYTVGHAASGTSGRNTHGQVADDLNTTGIYSQLRHPLYLGNFFMWLGPAMLTFHFWFIAFFVVAYMFYYERIMYAEEQFLHKKYGEKYKSWAERVPCILPKMSGFVAPMYPTNWKKILRQEKTGFMLLFLVFAVFYFVGSYATGSALDVNNIWFYLLAASVVTYILIKLRYQHRRWTRQLNFRFLYFNRESPALACWSRLFLYS